MAMFDFSGLADQVQKSVPKSYLSFTYHEIGLILEALSLIRDEYNSNYQFTDFDGNENSENRMLSLIEDLKHLQEKFETYEFH